VAVAVVELVAELEQAQLATIFQAVAELVQLVALVAL
jgi:hypothetical protein